MVGERNLEEKTSLSFGDFRDVLEKYSIKGLSYPAFSLDGYVAGVIEVQSRYSQQNNFGGVRFAVFKTREDGERSVFGVEILPGPVHDAIYLEESSKLRKALESEGIPFTDRRDTNKLRKDATRYARRLLEISEGL